MRRRYARTAAMWMALAAMGLLVAGCNKQRADLAKSKAESNVKQADAWKASTFPESKGSLEQAQKSLKEAQSNMDGKQYKQALTAAQDAVKSSQEALKSAKIRFADQQLQAAKKAVQVASANDGQNENLKLYEDAQTNVQAAGDKNAKQKYEDSITLSNKVIDDVEQLLARLKNASENQLSDLKDKRKLLAEVQAATFLPNALIKADEATSEVQKKIEVDRDYKQAIIRAGTAITEANAGVIETKKIRSTREIQTLENKIAEAIAEEAPIHTPEGLETVKDSFQEILTNFYENQYDTVLAASEVLKPRVDTLIVMTRIEATKDKIKTVKEGINRLKDQAVEQYLPGRIKVMEDLLAQSESLFNNNDYDGAKFQAGNALVEQDRIATAFDALAEKTIQDATAAVTNAQKTFQTMTSIFNRPESKVVDPRLTLERNTRTASLGATLDDAQESLQFANSNRGQKEFKKAIEQAKDASAKSDAVQNGTYRVVAQHEILGIQDQISELERQGAREFAPKQLAQTQTLVDQTQKLISENQNKEAADSAAKTRAYVENVKQELARQAVSERDKTEKVIQRIEGGAGPTPSSGGIIQGFHRSDGREYPGGSDLNNKEAMLAGPGAEVLLPVKSFEVAQYPATVNPTSQGWTGDATPPIANRAMPGGTFMKDQPGNYNTSPMPGDPSGAIIGNVGEPTVPTRGGADSGSSTGSYKATTGPGPFEANAVVTDSGNAATPTAAPDSVQGIRDQINEILTDDNRVRDINQYQPRATEQAREKLQAASEALSAQDYVKALDLARDAQRIILDAEMKAAKSAARANLQSAADRINLAEASGSAAFAPAQLTEAINLYDQATRAMDRGSYIDARNISERAVTAADDARLYNVTKARDLAALSTRYGGWKSSTPEIIGAEQAASVAEDKLANPHSAAEGQEIAKQAVVAAQVALDHARDFTFQERVDNIYKALNTAMRAGANYFNVTEVKRLIAELSVARDEYCTHNFDAVEMKLKDIEAALARVIETTPLVLEQNLVQNTDKLNALVAAGAENYMAQEVDIDKSLMNSSVIDFRKHDYQSSYMNIRNAMQLTDQIEERLQEQVYYDAVTELFAQLDDAFHNFDGVLNYDRAFMKKLVTTPNGQPSSLDFSGRMSPNAFKDKILDIYLRAIHLKPPKSQEGTHQQVILAIKYAKVASENFQKLYIMDQLSAHDAYDVIDTAFNEIMKAKNIRSELQVRLIDPEARTKVIHADKIVNF